MNKYEINNKLDFYDLVELIKSSANGEIDFLFKKDSDLFKNSSDLMILQSIAEHENKKITFDVESKNYKDYIEAVNSGNLRFDDTVIDFDEINEVASSSKGTKFAFLGGLTAKLKRNKSDSSQSGSSDKHVRAKKSVLVIIVCLLLIVIGTFALWWYVPSATVDLTVDSQVLVKILDVKVVEGQGEPSAEASSLPGFKVDVTETDRQTNPTTGKKETGTRATGEVTLFNKTDDEISVKKGTVIKWISTEDESFKYVTTEDIKVPEQTKVTEPAPSTTPEKIVYGQKTVKIEAENIGDKYNRGEGQKFEIDGNETDKLVGENEKAITGGKQETISTVSQVDINTLKKDLTELIQNKAAASLKKKVVTGQVLLDSAIKSKVTSETFSNKLDEEANELTLDVTASGMGLAYSQADLDKLVKELVAKVVPEEYSLSGDVPQYEVVVLNTNEDLSEVTLQIKISSHIDPKVDQEKITRDLAGMRIAEAEKYLSDLKNVRKINVNLSPVLPQPIRTMPMIADNIKIVIKTDDK